MSGWRFRVRAELEDARHRAHAAADVDDRVWAATPASGEWSVAQCLMHLNLTSRAFLPLLRQAVDGASRSTGDVSGGLGLTGAVVWWGLTLRIPVKTTEPFTPGAPASRPVVLEELDFLQSELLRIVEDAAERDVGATSLVSPFDTRFRYNAYAALRIVAAHQRLHIRQAEAAARAARSRWAVAGAGPVV